MDEDRHFHRVALAYINQVFQQISGINLSKLLILVILTFCHRQSFPCFSIEVQYLPSNSYLLCRDDLRE